MLTKRELQELDDIAFALLAFCMAAGDGSPEAREAVGLIQAMAMSMAKFVQCQRRAVGR